MKLKIRHIVAGVIILCSIHITPLVISMAYEFRGGHAFGGEYLLIPLGLMLALIILEVSKVFDWLKSQDTSNNSNKSKPERKD